MRHACERSAARGAGEGSTHPGGLRPVPQGDRSAGTFQARGKEGKGGHFHSSALPTLLACGRINTLHRKQCNASTANVGGILCHKVERKKGCSRYRQTFASVTA